MTSSFVSWSAGGRNRTTAALVSKRALVNEKFRRGVCRPSVRCWPENRFCFFSHMRRVPPSQLCMFCPRPHSIRCISSTRAPSSLPYPFAAFYIPHCIFIAGAIRVRHTRTSIFPFIVFSQTLRSRPLHPRFPPSLALEHSQTPVPKQSVGSFLPRQDPLRSGRVAYPRVYRRRHLV